MILPHDKNEYLISKRLVVAMVEYTSRCNLRCSYCKVSQRDWVGVDLSEDMATMVTNQIIKAAPNVVIMHGHGETTMLKNWVEHASYLERAGIKLSICSNLSKEYDEQELLALSKFAHIAVSIDTVNASLFKTLRRGADIYRVLYNIVRIKMIAASYDRQIFITWSIVCCDKTLPGLLELVRYGIELDINGFTFCNLTVYDNLSNDMNLIHISELSIDDCVRALDIFDQIKELCGNNNKVCQISAGIIDTIVQKLESSGANI